MKIEKMGSLHGNKIIWRYMSLEKFIDLLLHKSIYFANARKMEDRFEMEIPFVSLDEKKKYYIGRGMGLRKIDSTIEKEILMARKFKDNTYVSCWSLNNAESYALWKIYLGGSNNGVAIKSTVSNLIHCLESIDNYQKPKKKFSIEDIDSFSPFYDIDKFKIGAVDYKNQIDLQSLNKTNLAVTKKEFYTYEKEVRIFGTSNNQYLDPLTEEYKKGIFNGFPISLELDKLIDSIVLSPYSTPWFKENLKILIKKLNKNISDKIIDSEIEFNRNSD